VAFDNSAGAAAFAAKSAFGVSGAATAPADAKADSEQLLGLKGQLAEARRQLDAVDRTKNADVRALETQLADARRRTAELKKSLDEQSQLAQEKDEKLQVAAGELYRSSRVQTQAATQDQHLQARLDALQAQLERLMLDARAAYIEAAAPGRSGLAARQHAASGARLQQRLALLQKSPAPIDGQLARQIDVLLTRLAMIDPGDAEAVRLFAEAVTRSGVLERMEHATIAAGPQARSLLLEIRFVLMEPGQNVG
jgi:chromosome segregation ATPase